MTPDNRITRLEAAVGGFTFLVIFFILGSIWTRRSREPVIMAEPEPEPMACEVSAVFPSTDGHLLMTLKCPVEVLPRKGAY